MPSTTPIPSSVDEVIAEIASILAQGYLRHRKGQRISPKSGNESDKVEDSQVFRENRLDRAGHRSVHERTS